MSFGFSMQGWAACFDEPELSIVREFVARVSPGLEWEALLAARPRPLSFQLWTDFGHYWDALLEDHGVVAPYDAVHLLPIDFAASDAASGPCANLRPASPRAWLVVDAHWVTRSWPGHRDEGYEHRCRAYAKCFSAWMATLAPGAIEEAIETFEARAEAYEIVTSYLEIAWVEAAAAVCETRCPVSLFW